MRGALLGGGDALAGVDLLGRLEEVEHLVLARLRHLGEDRHEGRLHEEAGRLVRAGLAGDQAARRRRRVGSDVEGLQRQRVEHGAMVRDVDRHHRIVGEEGIEIVAGHLALLGEAGGVVAVAHHPGALGQLELRHVLLERRDDVGDRLDRPDRRQRHVGPVDDARGVHEVAVGVDEARQERLALQVDEPGSGPFPFGADVGDGAQRRDLAVLDGDRLGGRLRVVHGDDGAAEDDDVGCVGCKRRATPRKAA